MNAIGKSSGRYSGTGILLADFFGLLLLAVLTMAYNDELPRNAPRLDVAGQAAEAADETAFVATLRIDENGALRFEGPDGHELPGDDLDRQLQSIATQGGQVVLCPAPMFPWGEVRALAVRVEASLGRPAWHC